MNIFENKNEQQQKIIRSKLVCVIDLVYVFIYFNLVYICGGVNFVCIFFYKYNIFNFSVLTKDKKKANKLLSFISFQFISFNLY